MTLVIGGVGRARAAADRLSCAANQRVFGIAVMNYADDHDGRLPGPVWASVRHTIPSSYLDNHFAPLTAHLAPYLEMRELDESGLLLYCEAAVCPSLNRVLASDGANYRVAPSSVFGRQMGAGSEEYSETLTIHNVAERVRMPLSRIVAIYDWDKGDLGPIHGGGRNYLFLDGHVNWVEGDELIPEQYR
jgi:prepilin-type processing-associated H-X9-DG protein